MRTRQFDGIRTDTVRAADRRELARASTMECAPFRELAGSLKSILRESGKWRRYQVWTWFWRRNSSFTKPSSL